jgi:hypothetical protein
LHRSLGVLLPAFQRGDCVAGGYLVDQLSVLEPLPRASLLLSQVPIQLD